MWKINSFPTNDAFLWSKLLQNHTRWHRSSWTWCILVEKANRICWTRACSFRYLSQRKFTLRQGRSNTILNRWSTQKSRSIWVCLWIKGQAIDLRGDSRKPNFRWTETAPSHRRGSPQKSKDSSFWWSYFSSRSQKRKAHPGHFEQNRIVKNHSHYSAQSEDYYELLGDFCVR